jgi:hypothetical protein
MTFWTETLINMHMLFNQKPYSSSNPSLARKHDYETIAIPTETLITEKILLETLTIQTCPRLQTQIR